MAEVAADGASDSGLNKTLFDSLPDEMVVLTLSYVDPDTLVDCRLVCRRWQLLVENYAFQEKASRENEWVNDGRGFYSFSAIDRNTVRKLDLPWYVFRAICKHDPFHRNLIKNHCGQSEQNVPRDNQTNIILLLLGPGFMCSENLKTVHLYSYFAKYTL